MRRGGYRRYNKKPYYNKYDNYGNGYYKNYYKGGYNKSYYNKKYNNDDRDDYYPSNEHNENNIEKVQKSDETVTKNFSNQCRVIPIWKIKKITTSILILLIIFMSKCLKIE